MATDTELETSVGIGLRPLSVRDLGLIPYAECWELQKALASDVGEGRATETLLLLEHPHTYTCGRRGGRDHILIGEEELQREHITVLDVDRGGDVTYHGPGQLVAYPIINLRSSGSPIDYPGYVRNLEEVLIGVLADFGIASQRLEGFSGVWVTTGEHIEKIAAVGVKVDAQGITSHGVALNVATDLKYFSFIVPCGIRDKGVTSMARQLSSAPHMADVKSCFTKNFAGVFGFQL